MTFFKIQAYTLRASPIEQTESKQSYALSLQFYKTAPATDIVLENLIHSYCMDTEQLQWTK